MEIPGASLRIRVDDLEAAVPFYPAQGGRDDRRADVDEARRLLTELGARIVAGPVPTPVGRNLLAVHPDGASSSTWISAAEPLPRASPR